MRARAALALLFVAACGGETASPNACATPSSVVSCDQQDFFTFTLANEVDGGPTWSGSDCRKKPCEHGAACEVQASDGTFVEGVCE